MNKKKIVLVLASILTVSFLTVGCGSNAANTAANSTSSESQKAEKAVTIKNDIKGEKRELKFDTVPKRAISFNQSTTEMMLALGLGDRMVGTSYLDDEILPEYKDAYEKIEVLSNKYPTLEVVLAKNPDFLIGWPSAFTEKTIQSYKEWDKSGVNAYIPNSQLVEGQENIENIYQDISDLGKIFDVEDKANEVVDGMKKQVEDVKAKVSKVDKKVKVGVIDNYEDGKISTMGSDTLQANLIGLAGGENALPNAKGYAEISTEEFIKANPDVIIINDYKGATPVEERIKEIKENKALSDVNAVKNDRFVVVPLGETMVGVRNATGVERMAKGFYPELFK
ncbi:MAG: ABC transporter substrate-binding protein [Clostridium sp.]